jgi:hypothetical protein
MPATRFAVFSMIAGQFDTASQYRIHRMPAGSVVIRLHLSDKDALLFGLKESSRRNSRNAFSACFSGVSALRTTQLATLCSMMDSSRCQMTFRSSQIRSFTPVASCDCPGRILEPLFVSRCYQCSGRIRGSHSAVDHVLMKNPNSRAPVFLRLRRDHMDRPWIVRTFRRIDTGLPGPKASIKMPTNLSFIHGPIVSRAINLAG